MDIRRLARRIAVCSCVMLTVAPHAVRAQSAALSPELQSVRKLLDKYADPIAAVHDGFYSSVACITYPNGGGEGSMR